MLKYIVKPSKDFELKKFPIKELFVSPDLLYISGVTDYTVGLVDGEQILIKSPYLIGSELNNINVQTVKRQGIVEVSLKLPVKSITMPLIYPIFSDKDSNNYILALNKKEYVNVEGDTITSSFTQNYVEYNGDICYYFDSGNESTSGYLIDHKFYKASRTDENVEITTYLYIEDGKLQVGDYTYYADFSNGKPELRISKEYEPIEENELIGLIDGCECYFKTVKSYLSKEWKRVSKFLIQKHTNPMLNIENVLYGGYKHYITFNEENYYLRDVYQYDEEQGKDVYLGYGILLNNTFYEANNINRLDEYHDLRYAESDIYIEEYDEHLEIHDSLISPTNGGRFVIIIDKNEGNDIISGNFIVAESNYPITLIRPIETDEENKKYVEFLGKKYFVEDRLYDTVNISGEDYLLTYLDDEYKSASTVINGETVYLDINNKNEEITAKLSNKIYYKTDSSEENINVKYGIDENDYAVTKASGVTINNNRYYVFTEEREIVNNDETEKIDYEYITITENIKITFEITEINGSSTYIAYPVIDSNTIDSIAENELQREYCNIIVNNWKAFTFTVRKDTFGRKPLTVENGLMDSMSATLPYSISDAYLLENKIEIFRIQNYLSFKFPLLSKTANNLRREEIINNDFVEDIKRESINTIVDMEKDVYYPVYKHIDENNDVEFKPIQQIRFNLHFRTRNFDNWKIYEDDREFMDDDTPNYRKSNWFVTDLGYYKKFYEDKNKKVLKKLHNASDLLGWLNFTTDEIRNQSTKIGKSFIRLSFYSTNNPKTQVLLATSTIFFDENLSYKKYINSKRNSDMMYIDTKVMDIAGYSYFTKYQKDVDSGTANYQVSSNTISDSSEVYNDTFFNDDSRLSSRFVINDKYNTDTSSEGYYLYLFKEYSKKMREETIYMKVEFNHAGIGKTVAFMLPTKVDSEGKATPLYLSEEGDLEALKKGFALTDIYKQTYIPIKIKYDDAVNKYVYYLPDNIRENSYLGVDNEIMEFNLFETKFANESIVEQKRGTNESNQ